MSRAEAHALIERLLPSLMDGDWSSTQDEAYCALAEVIEAHLANPLANPLPPKLTTWLNRALERETEAA